MEQKQYVVTNTFNEVMELSELSNKQIKKYLNGIQSDQVELRSLSSRLIEEVLTRMRASMCDLVQKEDFHNSKKFHHLLLNSIRK
jgi:hypothetical protein